jgi:hypothetical protein
LNYDVKNNRKLALSDLFSAKNYLSVLSNYCTKDLRDRARNDSDSMISEEMMQSGASPHADNYRAVAITKKGLWVTFDLIKSRLMRRVRSTCLCLTRR